jgi:hypothetical protein
MRRPLAGLAVVLSIAATGLLGPASPACACDCRQLTDAEAYGRADAVFAGTAVRRDDPGGAILGSDDPVQIVFTVDTVYKGKVVKTQAVRTARDGASCGLEATVGQRYLVFADASGGRLEGELCGGTRRVTGVPVVAGVTGHPAAAGRAAAGPEPRAASARVASGRAASDRAAGVERALGFLRSAPGIALLGAVAAAAAVSLLLVVRRRRPAGRTDT